MPRVRLQSALDSPNQSSPPESQGSDRRVEQTRSTFPGRWPARAEMTEDFINNETPVRLYKPCRGTGATPFPIPWMPDCLAIELYRR